jgi:hypothetical protein
MTPSRESKHTRPQHDLCHGLRPTRTGALCAAALALALTGCSSGTQEDTTALLADEPEAAYELDSDEQEALFQDKAGATLSADERALIEQRLAASGAETENLRFVGRLILDGDVYFDADGLLGPAERDEATDSEATEKGKVNSLVSSAPSIDNVAIAPSLFAQERFCNSDDDCFVENSCGSLKRNRCATSLQFWRPKIDGTVVYVVPTNQTFLKRAFQAALTNIANAANDCLGTNLTVMLQSEWDQFPNRATTPVIFVRYGAESTVCPGTTGAAACAIYPRFVDFTINGARATFMVPGIRIGVDSADFRSDSPEAIGAIMHEVLHTLGLAHPEEGTATSLLVPGTSSSSTPQSIMRASNGGLVLRAEDKDMIDTLYSPLFPGNSCAYFNGFQDVLPN